MNNIFVYGTLLNDEILHRLIEGNPSKCNANLLGYKRVKVLDDVYPAILPERNSQVDGILLTGLSDSDVQTLDKYESNCYERKVVAVSLSANVLQQCETYVFKAQYYPLLSDEPWSNNSFRKEHLNFYLIAMSEEG